MCHIVIPMACSFLTQVGKRSVSSSQQFIKLKSFMQLTALNPCHEAPGLGIAHMDIVNAAGLEESCNGRLNFIGSRAFTRDDPAVFSVGFQRERKRAQLFRKLFRVAIALAWFRVDKD